MYSLLSEHTSGPVMTFGRVRALLPGALEIEHGQSVVRVEGASTRVELNEWVRVRGDRVGNTIRASFCQPLQGVDAALLEALVARASERRGTRRPQ